MVLTGTIRDEDGVMDHISAEGQSYEQAKVILFERVPDGSQLIAIRTDKGE